MRDSTDARAVFVDARFRDFIMVHARRRLYYGSTFGPEHAGFPLPQVIERRAVMADLYGPGTDLGGDARALASQEAPAYVMFRPEDDGLGDNASLPPPWLRLELHRELFRRVYDRDGYRVYAVFRGRPR